MMFPWTRHGRRAEKGNLEAGCWEAVKQIEEKQYVRTTEEDDRDYQVWGRLL